MENIAYIMMIRKLSAFKQSPLQGSSLEGISIFRLLEDTAHTGILLTKVTGPLKVFLREPIEDDAQNAY